MPEHDPLCGCANKHPNRKPGFMCSMGAECYCDCQIIAKARADERRKIEQERSIIWSEAMGGS